jgi:hypothetical protein
MATCRTYGAAAAQDGPTRWPPSCGSRHQRLSVCGHCHARCADRRRQAVVHQRRQVCTSFTFLVRSLQSAFHGVFVSDGGCYYCVFWLLQIVGFRQVLGAAAGQVSAIQNRGQRRPSTAKGRGPMSTCFSTAWCWSTHRRPSRKFHSVACDSGGGASGDPASFS